MHYKYQCKVRAFDFWRLSMYHTYHSFIGICNIVFGVSMILLAYRFWDQANDIIQALLFLLCLLVPVIQPLGVYMKAKAQAAVSPQGTELEFENDGIHVTLGGEHELIRWKRVKSIVKEAGMLIVFTDANHGYMLTDKVLGNEKEMFYEDVKAHINASAKG
ncbi:MAG: YcxB family protein [Butyrivibrio sp.]|nr:YcxB family protein [Butyrivibrio sp.]